MALCLALKTLSFALPSHLPSVPSVALAPSNRKAYTCVSQLTREINRPAKTIIKDMSIEIHAATILSLWSSFTFHHGQQGKFETPVHQLMQFNSNRLMTGRLSSMKVTQHDELRYSNVSKISRQISGLVPPVTMQELRSQSCKLLGVPGTQEHPAMFAIRQRITGLQNTTR